DNLATLPRDLLYRSDSDLLQQQVPTQEQLAAYGIQPIPGAPGTQSGPVDPQAPDPQQAPNAVQTYIADQPGRRAGDLVGTIDRNTGKLIN
ncbi:MAG: hypothetical protein J2P48_01260, partial [Alphaproteobacteria bacterium]|nr:hypothetical protein [Alphaproteobacteria bacterium]